MRILLIDDDKLSLKSMRNALKLHGFTVDAFLDPVEALAAFRDQQHELVFSDIMMDNYDGFQILRKIRQENGDTKIILFTGFFTARIDSIIRKMGATAFYKKPVPIEELIKHANEVLSANETATDR